MQIQWAAKSRLLLKSLSALVVLLLIAVIISAGVIVSIARDTDGRLWLLHSTVLLVNQRIGEHHIELEEVSSPELGEWSLQRLAWYEGDQLRLQLTEVTLRFDWQALFEQQLNVHHLSAQQMQYFPGEQITDKDTESSWPPSIDVNAWQQGDWAVSVQQLTIEQLQWFAAAHTTSGQETTLLPALQVNAQLALWQPTVPLQGQLQLRSLQEAPYTDWPAAQLQLEAQVPASQQLLLTLAANEPAGGWFAKQLQAPATEPLNIAAELTAEQASSSLDIALQQLHFPWQGRDYRLQAQLSLPQSGTVLTIEQAQLQVDQQQQQLQGQLTPETINLELSLDALPLDLITPWYPPLRSGYASGNYHIQGGWSAPSVEAEGEIAATVMDHIENQQGEWHAKWQGRAELKGGEQYQRLQLSASKARLQWQQGTELAIAAASGDGYIDFVSPAIKLAGSAAQIDRQLVTRLLQRLDVAVPEWLLGLEASAELQRYAVSGPFADEGKALQIDVQGKLKGTFQEEPLQMTLDAKGRWPQFKVQQLLLKYDTAELQASGAVDIFADGNALEGSIRRLSPSLLKKLPFDLAWPEGLTGELNGELSARGQLQQPRTTFKVNGTLQHPQLQQAAQLTLQGRSQPQQVVIETLQIDLQSDAQLQLQGQLDWQQSIPAMQWQLQTEDFPLGLFVPANWPDTGGRLSGELSLQLPTSQQIDANWLAAMQLAGRLHYRSGSLSSQESRTSAQPDMTKDGELPTHVIWSGEVGDAGDSEQIQFTSKIIQQFNASSATQQQTETGQLNLQVDKASLGQILLAWDSLPQLSLQASVDLEALAYLLPLGIDVGGQLQADLSLAGELTAPSLKGDIAMRNGRFASDDLGLSLQPIAFAARAEGQSMTITELRAEDGQQGVVTGQGQLNWQQPESEDTVQLQLQAQQLRLLDREEVHGEVTGNLQLTGSLQRLLLQGKLQVEPLNVSINSDPPGADIPSIEVSYQQDEAHTTSSWLPVLVLDVELHAERRAFLRGRGLDAELAGNLHLTGTTRQANLKGRFSVVRGFFELLGHRFMLEEGEATISDEALTILAVGKLTKAGTEITAQLAATNDQVEFTLSSDPSMPEDEILAWMMFGKSLQSISAAQAIQLASAVSTLRGGGFDPIGKTRDILGVDSLTFDTEETEEGTGVSVGAGKYLTEHVYLELERTPDPSEPWRSSITIELTPRLNLRSTLSTGSASEGVELEWHRDY